MHDSVSFLPNEDHISYETALHLSSGVRPRLLLHFHSLGVVPISPEKLDAEVLQALIKKGQSLDRDLAPFLQFWQSLQILILADGLPSISPPTLHRLVLHLVRRESALPSSMALDALQFMISHWKRVGLNQAETRAILEEAQKLERSSKKKRAMLEAHLARLTGDSSDAK